MDRQFRKSVARTRDVETADARALLALVPADADPVVAAETGLPAAGEHQLRSGFCFTPIICVTSRAFPFREIHNIVHDHLTAPVAFYISRQEFAEWFKDANATYETHWHNRNSWRGLGYIKANAEASRGN